MFLRTELQFRKLVLATLLLIGGVESNPGPSVTRKLKCGSCFKLLGKSTKTKPIIWCTICGWIHFVCSGLQSIEAYNKDTFTCTKCSTNRVISNELTSNPDFRKIQKRYTDPTYASAFGSAANLASSTGLPIKTVQDYLQTNSTYTKFKMARNKFPRLRVQSYRLNEIWSMDLADMQSLASANYGVRYLLVAVDTLSRFLRVEPVKDKQAESVKNAFVRMIKSPAVPQKIWTDDGKEFRGAFDVFCKKKNITRYQTFNEQKSAFAERNIRSLKALIYRYLHEHHTENYIQELQSFVKIINSRVNRVTGLAPKSVKKDHVPFLVSLAFTNKVVRPAYKIGDTVRIKGKTHTFHKGYKVQFSHEIFRIVSILSCNPPTYRLVSDETNENIEGRFYEAELVIYRKV